MREEQKIEARLERQRERLEARAYPCEDCGTSIEPEPVCKPCEVDRINDACTRSIRFGKWGLAEDPVGLFVTFVHPETGAKRLGNVYSVRCQDGYVSGFKLQIRYFCGDMGPEVSAGAVRVLRRDWEPAT